MAASEGTAKLFILNFDVSTYDSISQMQVFWGLKHGTSYILVFMLFDKDLDGERGKNNSESSTAKSRLFPGDNAPQYR